MNAKIIIANDEIVDSPHWVFQKLKDERKINPNTFIFFKHEWIKKQRYSTGVVYDKMGFK